MLVVFNGSEEFRGGEKEGKKEKDSEAVCFPSKSLLCWNFCCYTLNLWYDVVWCSHWWHPANDANEWVWIWSNEGTILSWLMLGLSGLRSFYASGCHVLSLILFDHTRKSPTELMIFVTRNLEIKTSFNLQIVVIKLSFMKCFLWNQP